LIRVPLSFDLSGQTTVALAAVLTGPPGVRATVGWAHAELGS
jgi:hypothetical protein